MSLARAKLELLRLALDMRLAELPSDSTKMNKRDVVRQELETTSLSAKPQSYRTLTKMAALSGQLNVRLCIFHFIICALCGATDPFHFQVDQTWL